MEGIFTRKKFIGPLGFMSICSIFLIGLYFFFLFLKTADIITLPRRIEQ